MKKKLIGTCPECGALKTLLSDGRIGRHGSGRKNVWPPQICKGWGDMPVEWHNDREAGEA